MKKLLVLCSVFIIFAGCATTVNHEIEQRNQEVDIYQRVEVCANDFIVSSEGSIVVGYFKNEELRIVNITVFQSRHRVILRFYPFDNYIVMVEETIRYATDKPLEEITEEDFIREISEQIIITTDDNSWYVEIFEQAVQALSTNNGEAQATRYARFGSAEFNSAIQNNPIDYAFDALTRRVGW